MKIALMDSYPSDPDLASSLTPTPSGSSLSALLAAAEAVTTPMPPITSPRTIFSTDTEPTPVPPPPVAVEPTPPPKKKKRKRRCVVCRRKLDITHDPCSKCDQWVCGQHRLAFDHECPHDYQKEQRDRIERANPVIKRAKFERI